MKPGMFLRALLLLLAILAGGLLASGWAEAAVGTTAAGKTGVGASEAVNAEYLRGVAAAGKADGEPPQPIESYVVLGWNDLGMHCYNRDFRDLAVLPPYNTLWAQVIRVGDPPEVVTTGLTVEYSFPDNTDSVGKSNFWTYDQQLFGVNLPDNVGLAGFGLSGEMQAAGDHFEAVGIPLTEFRDGETTPYPYQLAELVVKQDPGGNEVARLTVVAPVSTEMHCEYCHSDGDQEGIATGRVETNILTLHDEENLEEYPAGYETPLMNRRPVLCAECHSSNALGKPGLPGIPSLSKAMHEKHDGEVQDSESGCYSCHPGPQTQCLRDVMATSESQMTCIDCHGTMYQVSQKPNPWLNEPRCDNAACHGSGYAQDQALYRNSKGHGAVYCEGCHDSPHAIAPSREANDWIKFFELQGRAGPLDECTLCHQTQPVSPGPHGMMPVSYQSLFLPLMKR